MKAGIIIGLVGLLVWFGVSIIRIENQRYALELEMCGNLDAAISQSIIERQRCLETIQTRTNSFYHLIYGLGIL
jgi:hypothetical protein